MPLPPTNEARARSRSSRRLGLSSKPACVDPFADLDGEANEPEPGDDAGLTEQDREVMAAFTARLQCILDVKPPLPDNAFKTYVTDLITQAGALKQDVKNKIRSVSRRAQKENDPLRIALTNMDDVVQRHTQLLKCSLIDLSH